MTIEAKTIYFGRYTGKAKRVEPNPDKPITLNETWTKPGCGKFSEITIINDNTVILTKGHIFRGKIGIRSSSETFSRTLNGSMINKVKLKSKSDFFGRVKVFTCRP